MPLEAWVYDASRWDFDIVFAQTTSLLLEVASFHPATVRRTAQRLALRTDSSARFEKSLDPTLPRAGEPLDSRPRDSRSERIAVRLDP
jgi:hypothetical protein